MDRLVRIKIDCDKCVGSRICMAIAPKVFHLNESGQAAVSNAEGDSLSIIHAAAEACPVSAIMVEKTGQTEQDS